MKYAKAQKGNPNRLAINQHVFPVASLRRFANGGGVWVKRMGWLKPRKLSLRDPIFCAQRGWDQRSESGYPLQIERRFQALADRIEAGYCSLNETECNTVTEFYALWRHRAFEREFRQPDVTPRVPFPGDSLTQDQREKIEKNGCIVFDARGVLPGRMAAGIRIQLGIRGVALQLQGARWGVAESVTEEFIVPNCFGSALIVPVSPNIFLLAGMGDHTALPDSVRVINRVAVKMAFSTSNGYVAARDFSKCPL